MKISLRENVETYLMGLLVLTVIGFSITMLCDGINLSIISTANACSSVMA